MKPWYTENHFLAALGQTLAIERGLVDNPDDPGGRTIFGISKRSHPELWDPGPPTLEEAADCYFEDYWKGSGCPSIKPLAVKLELFDSAVLHGQVRGVKLLQEALNHLGSPVTIDGVLGPKTARVVNAYRRPKRLAAAQNATQAVYIVKLGNPTFFGGWLKRVHIDLED